MEPLAGNEDPSAQGGEGPAAGAAVAQAGRDSRCSDDAVADDVDEKQKVQTATTTKDVQFANIDVIATNTAFNTATTCLQH